MGEEEGGLVGPLEGWADGWEDGQMNGCLDSSWVKVRQRQSVGMDG